MPSNPTWFHRLDEICAELSAMQSPVVDREVVERVFGLKRRQAIELMHRFDGFRVGHASVLDRDRLCRSLEQWKSTPEVAEVRRSKQNLAMQLEAARKERAASQVRIPVPAEVFSQTVRTLPPAIRFETGTLTIHFGSVEQLLQRLVEISQAAANDYERFAQFVERLSCPPVRSELDPARHQPAVGAAHHPSAT